MTCRRAQFTPVPLSGICLAARKWIEQGNVKAVEVDHVAGYHRELMDLGDASAVPSGGTQSRPC